MNIDNIKEFIQLAKEEGVSELKYEEKDLKICVNFNVSTSVAPVSIHHPTSVPGVSVTADTSAESGLEVITSPFVGTFYSQSAPGKPAFVKVGDRVTKGQVVCILEAMKIMNEIEAEISGEVVEVCVDNENLVEFGQPLFKIRA